MAYVKVEGIVDKPLGDKGFTLIETVKVASTGQMWEVKWKIWTTKTIPAFSSFVEVRGELSEKINEYEYEGELRRNIDRSINIPEINILRAATEASPDIFGAPF
jgi:hypothetical protein